MQLYLISIHAPRAGRDKIKCLDTVNGVTFQSTRPVRGATFKFPFYNGGKWISIHAPRAGRDPVYIGTFPGYPHISIHAPRAGRDHIPMIHAPKRQ